MSEFSSQVFPASTMAQTQWQANNPLAAKANATIAYTDGACKGNPGAGGWGAHLIFSDSSTQDLYGGEAVTTNNRMELMGAIKALQYSPRDVTLEIWTDSSYVKNGITDWIDGWKKRGWKTASRKPVANQDLWQQLDELRQAREVEWHWVKGHAGHAGNEKADELANLGVTSDSEHDSSSNSNMVKKKATSALEDSKPLIDKPPLSTDNDWLDFDPLGLDYDTDDLDHELEMTMLNDEFSEEDVTVHADVNVVNTDLQSYTAADTLDPVDTTIDTPMSTTMTSNDTVPAPQNSDNIIAIDEPKFDGDTSRANPYFKPLLPKPIHRHESNRQLIMDTETTGLDPQKGDRVIEVGIVEMIGRKFTGEKLHVYINPQRGMDEEVIRIHGISEAFLADKPTFDQVAQALYDFMDGAEVIAHNASFDMNFLNMEFSKVGMADFAERVHVTDSLMMAKQQYPGQKNTLDALVRRLNVGKQDRTFHGALLDSEILAEVYLAMTGGQVTLAIEDDLQTDGDGAAHTHFSSLASLLLESSTDDTANHNWYASLVEDYPELKAKMLP